MVDTALRKFILQETFIFFIFFDYQKFEFVC